MTIIDRGKIKYSGSINDLDQAEQVQTVYALEIAEDDPQAIEKLEALPGVTNVEPGELDRNYRLMLDDLEGTSTSPILRGILDSGLSVVTFRRERKKLNQAFMDLTEQGVR